MEWDDLPADIQSLILKQIASLSETTWHREGEPGGLFLVEDDESELVLRRGESDERRRERDAYRDIQNCLLVSKRWSNLMGNLLAVYGPVEVVIAKGSETHATAAVKCWLAKGATNGPLGWYIGRQDLLALSIQRVFVGCMKLLLDQIPPHERRKYWNGHPRHEACYPHIAAANGQTAILQMLQRYEMDIDQPDWQGRTPLAVAVRQNKTQIADYLISVGANKDFTLIKRTDMVSCYDNGVYELCPIEWAAHHGTLPMVKILAKHGLVGPQPSQNRPAKPLFWALTRPDLADVSDIAGFILDHGDQSEIENHGPMHLLNALKHSAPFDLVQHLILRGAAVNPPKQWPGMVPLDAAIQWASEETIRLLVDHGARCTLDAVNAAMERNLGNLLDVLLSRCDTPDMT